MKALVGAFNQEKAVVGALSVIVKTDCGTDGSFYSTRRNPGGWTVLGSGTTANCVACAAPLPAAVVAVSSLGSRGTQF